MKRCRNSIESCGQIGRCKLDNSLCCIYPKEKCPSFVEKKFVPTYPKNVEPYKKPSVKLKSQNTHKKSQNTHKHTA